ncbi:heterogeneous nuclear ribonucleoprotein 1-like [Phoenix dactylifera]|uniref:Heterogeneous nuclear ribonucleoprotein 1-like n=1 Tax=Phoenix dactylifera TaxID=42345 RepID=A0A8B7D523_PHODC|nr:heterogeneous nuclear ribonucleoprotein 1-like [Phoenix dactylifera]XP_008813344.1 heterogeneous nuclear ribonucleoprotein 1-like [Phoenix dactylifera]
MELDHGKLFIGGISWDTNEDRLREYFKGFGEVVEAVIMKDRTTGRARGFGFVVFADPAVAERVVTEKHLIDGRMVEAKKAVPRDDQQILHRNSSSSHGSPVPGRTKKIFVGGLASTVTEADFKKYFEQFGTITDVVVMYDHNTRRPRGFGFITFGSEDAADKVLLKTFHELNGKMVEVKKAVPKELSPGPSMRSPVGGYNYGLSRVSSLLNAYTQAYNPSPIGGNGMRMDGRFGAVAGGRNGFSSFGAGYGIGLNFEPGMSPNFGGSSNFNNNINYGRALSPYYSGNMSRYSNPIGYSGGNVGTRSVFSSATRNSWGCGGLNYTTNSASSNALMASGSGSLGGFGNSSVIWGGSSSPILAHSMGSGSGYARMSLDLDYGAGESSFDTSTYGRIPGTGPVNSSFTASSNVYEGNYADSSGNSSIYGDTTWRTVSSELDGSGPFSYGLGNAASDVTAKGSAAYMGGHSVTNRQTNRGIAT